jgi:hypothetical protein
MPQFEEIRKELRALRRALERLEDLTSEQPTSQSTSEPLDLIVQCLIERGGPMYDYELVDAVGPKITWGKGGAEVWKSMLDHAPRGNKIVSVDQDGKRTPFVRERSWAMKRRGETAKDRYPGNRISLMKWVDDATEKR